MQVFAKLPRSVLAGIALICCLEACEKKSYRAYDPSVDNVSSHSNPGYDQNHSSQNQSTTEHSDHSSHSDSNSSSEALAPPVVDPSPSSDSSEENFTPVNEADANKPKSEENTEPKAAPVNEEKKSSSASNSVAKKDENSNQGKIENPKSADSENTKKEPSERVAHNEQKQPESGLAPHKSESPTEIMPIASEVSLNVVRSLDGGVRQGPECDPKSLKKKVGDVRCPTPQDQSISEAFWKLLVPLAYGAIDSPGPSIPDRTISKSQILKLVPRGSEFWKRYSKISNIHIFSKTDGPPLVDFDFLITFTDGSELRGAGSSDPKTSCLLIDKTFPSNGKAYFDVVEFYGNKKSKLQNPTRGKTCSSEVISRYRILNLSVDGKSRNPVPSFVMMLAKDSNRDQSYVLRKRFAGERDFMSVFLAMMNREKSTEQNAKQSRGRKR